MNLIKTLFLIAIIGHILCGYCDCLITYIPGGKRFDVKALSDNSRMQEIFANMPPKNPMLSMVLGCLALFLCSFGYYGAYLWMKQFSDVYAAIILISSALFFIPGTAHHVFCGAAEWFYVRLGKTDTARGAVLEFFKSTSATMIACYIGLIAFAITMFVGVLSGTTDLSRWTCVFNIIPIYIVLTPFRVGGTINWSAAAMFTALAIML